SFVPDGFTANDGVFTEDGASLTTTSVEQALVDGFSSFLLAPAGLGPDVINIGATPIVPPRNVVTGTSGALGFTALSFFDVTGFTIDTSADDGGSPNDLVTLNQPGLV